MSNRSRAGATIGLEAAKRVCQVHAQALIEPPRHFQIDSPAFFRRPLSGIKHLEITAAGDDIGFSQMSGQLGDACGLMLAVAVERDNAVIPPRERGFERGAQARAIPQVMRMADRADAGKLAQSSGVRSVEPSSTTSTSEAYFFTSVSTLTRLAASLYTGMAVSKRMVD